MNFKIDAALLREICEQAVCGRGAAHPILGHLHMQLSEMPGTLRVTSTDLGQARTEMIQTTHGEAGVMTVECQRLRSCLTGLSGEVTLSLADDGGHALLKLQGKRAYKLETLPPEEFPLWADETAQPIQGLTAQDFLKAVDRVSYAADPADARPYLHGLSLAGGFALASDGKTCVTMPLEGCPAGDGLILPKESLAALAACCKEKQGGPVEFFLLHNQHGTPSGFRAAGPETVVTTRLIDEKVRLDGYLHFRDTTGRNPVKAKLKTDELLAALDRLRPFCHVSKGHSTLQFQYADGQLHLTDLHEKGADAVSAEAAEDSEPLEGMTGMLNPEYLRRIAAQSADGEMVMTWKSEGDAYGFLFTGRQDEHILSCVRR